MTWYDLTPAAYAKALRYSADHSDECAARQDKSTDAWAPREAARYRRQARRLRAMALLCERSPADRAGDIDFHGLTDPSQSSGLEEQIVSAIEAGEDLEVCDHLPDGRGCCRFCGRAL